MNIIRFLRLASHLTVIVVGVSNVAHADSGGCKTGTADWDGRSLEELVEAASAITYATVTEFTESDEREGFEGYYQLVLQDSIYGDIYSAFRLFGAQPYTQVPQHYLDITARHAGLNVERLYGGTTGVLGQEDDHCVAMPKFVIGYNYLIFSGVQSTLAFEPINSPDLDHWLLSTVSVVEEMRMDHSGE